MSARLAFVLPTLYVALLVVWLALESALGPIPAAGLASFVQTLITTHLLLAWVWCGWIAETKEPAAAWWGGAGLVLIPAPLYTLAALTGALGFGVAATINVAAAALVIVALGIGRGLSARRLDPALRRIAFTLLQAGPAVALWALRPLWLPLIGSVS